MLDNRMGDGEKLVPIPGGTFQMGSESFYPEEAPIREIMVAPFWIDPTPVTNGSFARFVAETGHRTAAELNGGSLVFTVVQAAEPIWKWTKGACWRRPLGSPLGAVDYASHPVVHVDAGDASAFAAWAGKRLLSEAEWEWAARGGLCGADYAWGDALRVDGRIPANIWRGVFPVQRDGGLSMPMTTPVGSFPANGFGLYDMIGNVWEITADAEPPWNRPSCSRSRGEVGRPHVIKGGSHLCAENYCQRYRPAARQQVYEPTGHIGFRCGR